MSGLTKWEIGQDLIKLSDYISSVRADFKLNGNKTLDEKLKVIQAQIGDLFEDNNDHSFGILNSRDLREAKKIRFNK